MSVKRPRGKAVLVTVCLRETDRLQMQVKSKNVQGPTDIQDAYRFGGEGKKKMGFRDKVLTFCNSSISTGTSTGILRPSCSPHFPQSSIHFIYEV